MKQHDYNQMQILCEAVKKIIFDFFIASQGRDAEFEESLPR